MPGGRADYRSSLVTSPPAPKAATAVWRVPPADRAVWSVRSRGSLRVASFMRHRGLIHRERRVVVLRGRDQNEAVDLRKAGQHATCREHKLRNLDRGEQRRKLYIAATAAASSDANRKSPAHRTLSTRRSGSARRWQARQADTRAMPAGATPLRDEATKPMDTCGALAGMVCCTAPGGSDVD